MKQTICQTCGKLFLQKIEESHHYCRICSNAWRKKQEQEREQLRVAEEKRRWQEQKKQDQEIFEKEILKYDVVPSEKIIPSNRTLYIMGNGFDLMHRVPSSYYAFRDSLGKNNSLRCMLETVLTPDDIWADFENALGKMNFDLMGSRFIIDSYLEDSGFYDKDSGAAEYYMAVESAANPIISIVNKLQPSFRRWVSTLCVGTDDRPLENLICPEGKVLNFNYTEFVETLCGVNDVCYIHGCRKNKKDKLILGHKPGLDMVLHEKERKPRTYRQQVVSTAQDNVFDLIGKYDEELTKNSQEIIRNNRRFFDSLTDVDQVVVIGHSLSKVDWDYFHEIKSMVPEASWYFGVFGFTALKNLQKLVDKLDLKHYFVFRTDGISTSPNKEAKCGKKPFVPHEPRPRIFTEGGTMVTVNQGYDLTVDNSLEVILPSQVKKVVFLTDYIFVFLNDIEANVLLLNKQNEKWRFTACLESIEHQSIVNRRLRHVFFMEESITFVYNNRVKVYDLQSGSLISNRQIQDAKSKTYNGLNISDKFIRG